MKKLTLVILLVFICGLLYGCSLLKSTGEAKRVGQTVPISVDRVILSSCKMGQNCIIKLNVKVNQNTEILGIEEKIPTGWTLVSSNPEVSFINVEKGKITWLFGGQLGKGNAESRTITYTLTSTTKENQFSGVWTTYPNEKRGTVGGKQSVRIR